MILILDFFSANFKPSTTAASISTWKNYSSAYHYMAHPIHRDNWVMWTESFLSLFKCVSILFMRKIEQKERDGELSNIVYLFLNNKEIQV